MKLIKALILTGTEAFSQRPQGSVQYPQVSNQTAQVSDQVPQVSDQVAQISNQYPQVSNQTEQISNQSPQVSNQVPQVSDQVPQVSDQVAQVSDQVAQVSDQVPQVSDQVPQVSDQVPQVSDQVPQVSNQVPQVTNQKPQVSNQTPQGDDWFHPSNWESCPAMVDMGSICNVDDIIRLTRQRLMWKIRHLTDDMIAFGGPLHETAVNDFNRFMNNWKAYRDNCPARDTVNNCQSICQYDYKNGYDSGYIIATIRDMSGGLEMSDECRAWNGLTLGQFSSNSHTSANRDPIEPNRPTEPPKTTEPSLPKNHPNNWTKCPINNICNFDQIVALSKERLYWQLEGFDKLSYLDAVGDNLDFVRHWDNFNKACNVPDDTTANNCQSICAGDKDGQYFSQYLYATFTDTWYGAATEETSESCKAWKEGTDDDGTPGLLKMLQLDNAQRESLNLI